MCTKPVFLASFIFILFSMATWRLGFANVNGILSKIDHVRGEIISGKFDIFGIAKSKINSSILDSNLLLDGYSVFLSDRKKGGGGVLAYVNSSLSVVRLKTPADLGFGNWKLELLPLRVSRGTEWIIFLVVYIPRQSADVVKALTNFIHRSFRSQNRRLVIVGDFNANLFISSPARTAVNLLIWILYH